MTDNGWILTSDQKPESDKWVITIGTCVSSMDQWTKMRWRELQGWSDWEGMGCCDPLKWRYPWPEPQEDTAEILNLEMLDLQIRLLDIGWKLTFECDRLTFTDETD